MEKQRSKKLLFLAIALSSVSLVTVGFSSWIIGVQNNKVNLDNIKVDVDTVANKTAALDVKIKDGENHLTLGETSATESGNGLGYIVEESKKADFTIELEKFDFVFPTVGASFKGINFNFLIEGENKSNTADVDYFSRNNTQKEYIKLASANITSDELVESNITTDANDTAKKFYKNESYEAKGFNYYSLTNKEITFSWSSYFNNENPTSFYNKKFQNGGMGIEDKITTLNNINKEFDALKKNLEGATIKITISLDAEFTA